MREKIRDISVFPHRLHKKKLTDDRRENLGAALTGWIGAGKVDVAR